MTRFLLVLGMVAMILGFKAMIDFQGFKSSPIRVMGEVVEIAPGGVWMRVPQQARVLVRYEYNGQEFNKGNTALSKRWAALQEGDRVELILIASNPSKFILADSLGDTSALAPVLIAFGSLLLAVSYFIRK